MPLNIPAILAIAEHFDNSPDKAPGYDQRCWCSCIVGQHYWIEHETRHLPQLTWSAPRTALRPWDLRRAPWPEHAFRTATVLGLSYEQAFALFNGTPLLYATGSGIPVTRAIAAATLRHLAATGVVDWETGRRIAERHETEIRKLQDTASTDDADHEAVSSRRELESVSA